MELTWFQRGSDGFSETPILLIRNQQVLGSIPSAGSITEARTSS